MTPDSRNTVPGLNGVEHVAFTVPDVAEAIRFFVDVLGFEHLYDMGPFADPDGRWMSENLDVHPDASIPRFALLRCANGANFEIFEYQAPDQVQRWPRLSDWGGSHIAFYVEDMNMALAALEARGVQVLGEGKKLASGPEAGPEATYAHFLTPWGQILEFVSYPQGRAYEKSTQRRLWKPEQSTSSVTAAEGQRTETDTPTAERQ